MQVLPTCLLLHFAAADIEEAQGNIAAAQQVYQGLLPSLAPADPQAPPPPQVCALPEQAKVLHSTCHPACCTDHSLPHSKLMTVEHDAK